MLATIVGGIILVFATLAGHLWTEFTDWRADRAEEQRHEEERETSRENRKIAKEFSSTIREERLSSKTADGAFYYSDYYEEDGKKPESCDLGITCIRLKVMPVEACENLQVSASLVRERGAVVRPAENIVVGEVRAGEVVEVGFDVPAGITGPSFYC